MITKTILERLSMSLLALSLTSCVTVQENIGKAVGTTVGAGLGLVACKELGGSDAECAAAAVVGGVVGYSLGAEFDNRKRRLAEAAEGTGAEVEFETIKVSNTSAFADVPTSAPAEVQTETPAQAPATSQSEGLLTNVRQAEMFVVGSDQPTAAALNTFRRLAGVYAEQIALDDGTQVDTRLLIVGHADASGGARRNQVLSERRAFAIAQLFNEAGLPAVRLYVSGAGSSQPIADNETPGGREQNRRVEILEISDEAGLLSFADLRKSDPAFLQHSTRDPEQSLADNGSASSSESTTGNSSGASGPRIDFAGVPANLSDTTVLAAIGSSSDQGGLLSSLVPTDSEYQAGDSRQPSIPCVADSPRISGSVVNLASGEDVSARNARGELMPGMNQRPWQTLVNGHMVSVSPVSLLRANGQPAATPLVSIYRDYANQTERVSAKLETLVESYMSERGILYRLYALEAGSEIYCADIALPLSAPFQAMQGRLYYKDGPSYYEQTFQPVAVTLE